MSCENGTWQKMGSGRQRLKWWEGGGLMVTELLGSWRAGLRRGAEARSPEPQHGPGGSGGSGHCCCLVGVSCLPSTPVLSSRKGSLVSIPGLGSIQSGVLWEEVLRCILGKVERTLDPVYSLLPSFSLPGDPKSWGKEVLLGVEQGAGAPAFSSLLLLL